jgi:hypothetical protein
MKALMIMFLLIPMLVLFFFSSCKENQTSIVEPSQQKDVLAKQPQGNAVASVYATGLNNPRGLRFGPDGYLYVAEGGTAGGTLSTIGQCDQVPGAGPYLGGFISRISKISRDGNLYVSNNGFGIPVPGAGEIVKITLN